MGTLFRKLCTASYINADSNFEIYNLEKKETNGKYDSVVSLLLNLLQRGNPAALSSYLKTRYEYKEQEKFLHLFSKNSPNWGEMIKGNDDWENYPARKFYDDILPKYFTEYPYLQQLLIPEVIIGEIIPKARRMFAKQQVDFFLPAAKLIVEIDGPHHEEQEQINLDVQRDLFLKENGYQTIRIPSKELHDSEKLEEYIAEIKNRINEFSESFEEYRDSYKKCIKGTVHKELELVAVMRLQITLLHLCLCGMISLEDEKWQISIKNHEVSGYEHAALEDVFLWIENICCMAGIGFRRPFVVINQVERMERVRTTDIRIEMSVLERATPCNTKGKWIFVYNAWRQELDYFTMHTAKRIFYDLYQDDLGDDQDEPYNGKRRALRFVLKNIFGFDEFRQGQERIVINALKGRDTIGVLPTGSGKSLCYQLAVLLQPCVSFCVCPIKSLMVDQDLNLKQRGMSRTAFLSSELSQDEKNQVQQGFADGKYWFVFVSPERFQNAMFRNYLTQMSTIQNLTFAYAVLDEVHCLSEWGHDFRVSYLNLTKTIRRYCPEITMFGLTATASYNVLKNILIEFRMKDKRDVISTPSFTRPELHFNVEKLDIKQSKYHALCSVLERYRRVYPDLLHDKGEKSRCGIVFFPFVNGKNGCFEISKALEVEVKEKVGFYSGEAPKKFGEERIEFDVYKKEIQKAFKGNEFTLLCATKAFGMGIDKPNIRYTIHYGIPSSLEALYQEAGRAGRDRKKAACTILYHPESENTRNKVEEALAIGSTVETLKNVVKDYGRTGQDMLWQMYLMSGGMNSFEEELKVVERIIEKCAEPSAKAVKIYVDRGMHNGLQEKQKYLYHLSLIGVVEDWTVDWKESCICVDFNNYTKESIFKCVEQYIRNYETDYQLIRDPEYIKAVEHFEENYICAALAVFWKWYYNNIVYSRKQALKNVMDACDSFRAENPEEFKEKIEAYFRLDDMSDKLGVVADEPREYKHWFEILNVSTIKKEKVGNILMGLSRFLESYQNNVGLNYIFGFLNMINQRFKEGEEKERMLQALNTIKSFKESDRLFILQESARVMYEVGNDEAQEAFAEFFVSNFPMEDSERYIYNIQGDNYSLKFYLEKILAKITKDIEETTYGKC